MHVLVNGERALVKFRRLSIFTFVVVQNGEVVKNTCITRMVRAHPRLDSGLEFLPLDERSGVISLGVKSIEALLNRANVRWPRGCRRHRAGDDAASKQNSKNRLHFLPSLSGAANRSTARLTHRLQTNICLFNVFR
jgi:hypothetical protein